MRIALSFSVSPNNPKPAHANQSIKMVAGYEIIKGLVALAVAVAVVIWHSHLPDIVHHLLAVLHHLLGHFFTQPLDNLGHHADRASENWLKAFWFILGYAVLRFVEAYGLFKDRTWAYWYSVLGYGIFIPIELYSIMTKPFELFTVLTFILNIIIVVVVYLNMKQKGLLGKSK